ncbi:MAG: hypothetical protein AAFN77_15920 [Planctomycetota bacterium]
MTHRTSIRIAFSTLASLICLLAVTFSNTAASICPFCSSVALTFTEQLNSNEIAVVAKLIEPPPPPKMDDDGFMEFPKGQFEIVGVLKGQKLVKVGMTFQTQLIGAHPVGQKFLVMGVNPPRVAWTTPMRTTDRVFDYLLEIQKLPPNGPDRLVFFQDYFEDKESVLAFDAYDEYAKAPYEDLIAMKDRMDRDQLLGFIDNPETTASRRRLYLTMLGVCGTAEDAERLEGYLKSGDRKKMAGLDALIACYLRLKGADGLPLVEETFLRDKTVDYVDVVAAVMALRFHATETDVIPQKRIVETVRILLDRPKVADMIILDLARWKDWSVMERLVGMFKDSKEDSSWIRIPIITYLRACPDPKAAAYIEELRKIDANAVKRADFYIGFGEDEEDSWDDDDEDESSTSTEKEKPASDDSNDSPPQPKTPGTEQPESNQEQQPTGGTTEKGSEGGSADVKGSGVELTRVPAEVPLVESRVSVAQGDPIQIEAPATSDVSPAGPQPDDHASSDSNSSDPIAVPFQGNASTFVSTSVDPDLDKSGLLDDSTEGLDADDDEAELVAAVAAADSTNEKELPANMTWKIILVPFLGSLLILATMWSVVNGWFERLIY